MKTLAAIVFTLGASLTLLGVMLQPEIAETKKPFVYVPSTTPSGVPGVRPTLDLTTLIIQQSVNCWLGGLPGATCGPERTYL